MAYDISVYRKSDISFIQNPPTGVFSEAFDCWLDEVNSRPLYENPLGSGDVIYRLWAVPAATIGLQLLATIYRDGLIVAKDQLTQLEDELSQLELYWNSIDLTGEGDAAIITIDNHGCETVETQTFREHLCERMGYFREAIAIARLNDGVIMVS